MVQHVSYLSNSMTLMFTGISNAKNSSSQVQSMQCYEVLASLLGVQKQSRAAHQSNSASQQLKQAELLGCHQGNLMMPAQVPALLPTGWWSQTVQGLTCLELERRKMSQCMAICG